MVDLRKPKYTVLIAATGLLIINFWAWSLLSPLATAYGEQLALSSVSLSLLVAAPVLVGSLARIPFGLLADRYGGRIIFAVVCLISSGAVAGLSVAASYNSLLLAAFGLGTAGAAFAVGVPYVNAWFPKHERGLALGIYAMGNAGTAISGLLTPHLVSATSRESAFYFIAAVLLLAGVAVALWGRNAPRWKPAKAPMVTRLKQALAWKLTWRLAMLYAITFGAFIALGLYLPVLLNQSYGLTPVDAASRAAGFVLLATLVRPLGGWFSDRFNGIVVLRVVFLAIFMLAALSAARPSLSPIGTIVYLGLAASLGVGNGAIFAIIGHRCDTKVVGAVTGLVGAAGGLGGFFPPLLMGVSYQFFHSYSAALLMLAVAALLVFAFSKKLLGTSTTY